MKKTEKQPSIGIEKYFIFIYIIPLIIFAILLQKYIGTRYTHLLTSLFYFAIPALLALIFVIISTPLLIIIAKKMHIVNTPKDRDSTKKPTPLLGGTAIFAAFMTITLSIGHFYCDLSPQILSILLGGSLIFLIGTIDDIKPLSSQIRLLGQVAAAWIVMSNGLLISFMPETIIGNILAYIITFIWIIGIINATNFLDGADGLAVGVSVIAAIFFFLITLHLNQTNVTFLCAVFIGAGAGFLFYNFKPAKIYLGDGGSTFLGFVLACIALYGGWSDNGFVIALGIPVLILGVLIFDMIYITISRIRNGNVTTIKEWLNFVGQDHFHHRLMNLGFREENAVFFIYTICILLGANALELEFAEKSYPVVTEIIQSSLVFIIITILMLVGRQTE